MLIGLCGLSGPGLQGPAGSGKDTVAYMIHETVPSYRIALADPLKVLCGELWGWSRDQLYGSSELRNMPDTTSARWKRARSRILSYGEEWCREIFPGDSQAYGKLLDWYDLLVLKGSKLSPRIALQTLGTEWGRHHDPDVWARIAIQRSRVLEGWERTYWDHDVPLGAAHCIVTDVRFPNEAQAIRKAGGTIWGVARPGRPQQVGLAGHASELGKIIPDLTIRNDSTLEVLQVRIWTALSKLSTKESE